MLSKTGYLSKTTRSKKKPESCKNFSSDFLGLLRLEHYKASTEQ